jgi:hypothetical protein
MDPILALVNPGHAFKTYFFKIHFIDQISDLYFEDAGVHIAQDSSYSKFFNGFLQLLKADVRIVSSNRS